MIQDFDEVNTVWTWTGGDGSYKWDLVHLNNFIYGDTDSGYISMEGLPMEGASLDEIVEVADTIGNMTNDAFPDFVMHAFNCPAERNDTIKTAREVVSDKSFFLTKKRYIMHVVDNEGKRVSKLKEVGVEVKKSDTSIAIKKMLTDLVDMILDGLPMSEVLDTIDDMRRSFGEFTPKEISKPISVKTLKRCQDEYAMTGSMKGFPYQVRAAMFWNEMCSITDKKIMPGEKVALLYIKHPESKYIAFPIDMTIFPDWFHEINIDYDTEWQKAKNKLVNYLKAMGWDVESQKKEIRQDLFGF